MGKILGVAAAAITFVMALACGGNNNADSASLLPSLPSTVSYKGTIDFDVIGGSGNETGISVVAYRGATKVGTASPLTESNPIGFDWEYTIDGLTSGNEYTFKVIKASVSGNIELLSTIDTANSTTGTLSKANPKYKTRAPQINVYTTFVVQQVSANPSLTVESATRAIFGANVSLSSIVVTGGNVSDGQSIIKPTAGASQMVLLMSTSILSAVKLTVAELDGHLATLKATQSAVSAINVSTSDLEIDKLSTTLSPVYTAVSSMMSAITISNFTIDLKKINPNTTLSFSDLKDSTKISAIVSADAKKQSAIATVSYKGTIDYDVIGGPGNQTGISVVAYSGATKVGTSALTESNPAGYDWEYSIAGLTSGNEYTFKVIKTATSGNIELLSTIDTASASTGFLSKANPKYKTRAPQINVYTTFVVQQIVANPTLTVSVATASIFGSGVSLNSIVVSGGTVRAGTTASVVAPSAAASQMVTMLSTSILTAVKLTVAQLDGQLTSLIATQTAISKIPVTTVTTANLATSLSTVYTAVSAMMTAITTAIPTFTIDLTKIDAHSTLTITDLKDSTKISTNVVAAATAQDSAKKVTYFGLADATYGAPTTAGFAINTLAPVFKVVVEGDFSANVATASKIAELLDMTVTNTVSKQTASSSNLNSLFDATASVSANVTTIYLRVKKTASATISADELAPGTDYDYVLTAKTKAFTFGGSYTTKGTISTRTVTFTYPYAIGSLTSQVVLGSNGGLSAGSIVFYVNSAKAINVTTSAVNNYSILGASSALNVSVSPATTVTPVISGITTGATTATSAVVTFNSVTKGNYTVTLTKDKGLFSGTTEITDYPSSVYMEVK